MAQFLKVSETADKTHASEADPKKTVLIMGATGLVGGAVARSLLSYPWFQVRVVTRRPWCLQAQALERAGASVVEVDFNYKHSLILAMRGVTSIFMHTAFWEDYTVTLEVSHGRNMVDAAKEAGIHHIVYNGTNYKKPTEGRICSFLLSKLLIEDMIVRSGIPYTIVVLPFYFENFLTVFKPVEIIDQFYAIILPLENRYIPCGCLHDLAICICKVLQQGMANAGMKLPLVAEMLSTKDIVQKLEADLDVRFIDPELTLEDYNEFGFLGAKDLAAMFKFYQTTEEVPDFTLTRNLNFHIRNFSQWIVDNTIQIMDLLAESGPDLSSDFCRPPHLREILPVIDRNQQAMSSTTESCLKMEDSASECLKKTKEIPELSNEDLSGYGQDIKRPGFVPVDPQKSEILMTSLSGLYQGGVEQRYSFHKNTDSSSIKIVDGETEHVSLCPTMSTMLSSYMWPKSALTTEPQENNLELSTTKTPETDMSQSSHKSVSIRDVSQSFRSLAMKEVSHAIGAKDTKPKFPKLKEIKDVEEAEEEKEGIVKDGDTTNNSAFGAKNKTLRSEQENTRADRYSKQMRDFLEHDFLASRYPWRRKQRKVSREANLNTLSKESVERVSPAAQCKEGRVVEVYSPCLDSPTLDTLNFEERLYRKPSRIILNQPMRLSQIIQDTKINPFEDQKINENTRPDSSEGSGSMTPKSADSLAESEGSSKPKKSASAIFKSLPLKLRHALLKRDILNRPKRESPKAVATLSHGEDDAFIEYERCPGLPASALLPDADERSLSSNEGMEENFNYSPSSIIQMDCLISEDSERNGSGNNVRPLPRDCLDWQWIRQAGSDPMKGPPPVQWHEKCDLLLPNVPLYPKSLTVNPSPQELMQCQTPITVQPMLQNKVSDLGAMSSNQTKDPTDHKMDKTVVNELKDIDNSENHALVIDKRFKSPKAQAVMIDSHTKEFQKRIHSPDVGKNGLRIYEDSCHMSVEMMLADMSFVSSHNTPSFSHSSTAEALSGNAESYTNSWQSTSGEKNASSPNTKNFETPESTLSTSTELSSSQGENFTNALTRSVNAKPVTSTPKVNSNIQIRVVQAQYNVSTGRIDEQSDLVKNNILTPSPTAKLSPRGTSSPGPHPAQTFSSTSDQSWLHSANKDSSVLSTSQSPCSSLTSVSPSCQSWGSGWDVYSAALRRREGSPPGMLKLCQSAEKAKDKSCIVNTHAMSTDTHS